MSSTWLYLSSTRCIDLVARVMWVMCLKVATTEERHYGMAAANDPTPGSQSKSICFLIYNFNPILAAHRFDTSHVGFPY